MVDQDTDFRLRQAWEDAETIWGKLSVILFYSFVWYNILSSAWQLILPSGQGGNCLMDKSSHKDSFKLFKALTRSMDLFLIGFLMFANAGGIKWSNVTMVTVFFIVNALVYMPIRDVIYECEMDSMFYWGPGWILLAWICTILEMKFGGREGSEEERRSLY